MATKNTKPTADQPTTAPVPEPAVNLVNVWTPTLKVLIPLLKEPAKPEGKGKSSLAALERRGLAGELNGTYSITDAGKRLVNLLFPKGATEPALNLNDLPKARFDELYALATGPKPAPKASGVLVKRGLAEAVDGGFAVTAAGDLLFALLWPSVDAPAPKPTPRKRTTRKPAAKAE